LHTPGHSTEREFKKASCQHQHWQQQQQQSLHNTNKNITLCGFDERQGVPYHKQEQQQYHGNCNSSRDLTAAAAAPEQLQLQ